MHKAIYASGFLYHPLTEQILLQKTPGDDSTSLWSLFTGLKQSNEDFIGAFQRIIAEQLQIKLYIKNIFHVYEYEREEQREWNAIHYAEVKRMETKPLQQRKMILQWFTFKQLYKLPLSLQAKQDLIVGQRVILANFRDKQQEITPNTI